jgi:DNA-binding HxlR family transcriptional regulator
MKVTDRNANHCPVEVTLSVISGKWKPLILWHVSEGGVRRFLELQRAIPGITRKMLTQHLQELERDGIVARQVFDEMPLRVEYSPTKYGQTLRPLMRMLYDWGSKHEAYVARNGPRSIPRAERPAPKWMAIAIG